MKNKIIIGIITFIGIILLYNIKVEATFKISNFQIDCNVEENGDIEIEENITYYTDETKNGLIRTITPKNSMNQKNSADDIILESVKVDGQEYSKTYDADIGDSGVFTYTKSGNTNEIKVFSPFTTTIKTITYQYKLTNVAVKYDDTAELYWNFIGEEWDCDIDLLNINIILPQLAQNGTVYVYGHGSDNGRFIKKGNFITLTAENIKAYQAIDARILFPRNAILNSTKVVNKQVLDEYRDKEEGMTKKREQPKVMMGLTVNQIALAISVVILIIGIIIYFKYDKEYKVQKYKYYREIPYDLEPEILQRIYYGKNTKNAFWITFLNLIKKGVFKIEKTINEVGKETEKIILEKDIEDLKSYQGTVKRVIKGFMPIVKTPSIDLLELQAKMKRSRTITYRYFQKELDSEIEGLFGEVTKAPKKVITILGICMAALIVVITIFSFMTSQESGMGIGIAMFLGMTAIVYSAFFARLGNSVQGMLFLLVHCGVFQVANLAMLNEAGIGMMYIPYVLLFILIQYVVRVKRVGKEERQIREQIKGLRRYIKDYSLLSEKEEITYIKLWEDYFILAIALGLNNKIINGWYEYGQNFTDSNLHTSFYNVGGYTHFSTTMMPTFISYASYSTSFSGSGFSGSSGGFSGGSSSGGGGRRRRWRKFFLNLFSNSCQKRCPFWQ